MQRRKYLRASVIARESDDSISPHPSLYPRMKSEKRHRHQKFFARPNIIDGPGGLAATVAGMLRKLLCCVLLLASPVLADKWIGVDANYWLDLRDKGTRWSAEPFPTLADAGFDSFRLRIWTGDDGANGLTYATRTALAAKAAGLKPYAVIFLSENWADLVKQPAPAIWKDLTGKDKTKAITDYTEKVARHLQDAGLDIELFEIGNEIDFGVCGVFEEAWPHRVSIEYMRQNVWPDMVPLLRAAQLGVQKVRPDAKFLLHLAQWQNAEYCDAFFNFMSEHKVQLDYAGLSYFPTSAERPEQRTLAFMSHQIDTISAAVKRPVVICESGYPAAAQFGGQFSTWNKPIDGYTLDEAGQAKWLADYLAMGKSSPHVAGLFYWSPEWINGGLWDAFALFDSEGKVRLALLPALQHSFPRRPASAPAEDVRPVPAPAVAANVHACLGNLHSHTANSDGAGTPAEAYAYARDVAKLDFLAITDHNHILFQKDKVPFADIEPTYSGSTETACIPAANKANQDGKFVALYGEEYSSMSQGNHVNVFDTPAVIDVPNGKFDGLLNWIHKHPDSTGHDAVVMFNHPGLSYPLNAVGKKEYGRDDFGDDANWIKQMGGVTSLIEILNGEPKGNGYAHVAPQIMDGYLRIFLRLGFHLAPTGDQDNHHQQWGTITDARTGILATELTRPALLNAMRARHVYASEDKNLKVIAVVNDHLCGDILNTAGPTKVAIHLDDADEPDAKYTIDAYSGVIDGDAAKIVQTVAIDHEQSGDAFVGFNGPPLTTPGQFLYFRISQIGKDGSVDHAWTAPVWYQKQP